MEDITPVKVLSINLISSWEYDTKTQDCLICRTPLMMPPPTELDKINEKNKVLPIIKIDTGVCSHTYHRSCIAKLSTSTGIICPQCNLPWSEAETVDTSLWSYKNVINEIKPIESLKKYIKKENNFPIEKKEIKLYEEDDYYNDEDEEEEEEEEE